MPITVTAASAKPRPTRLPLTTALPLVAVLLSAALLVGLRVTNGASLPTGSPLALNSEADAASDITAKPGAEDVQEQNRQFHLMIAEWAVRAHNGHGQATITSDEVKQLSHLANDICPHWP